MSSSSGRRMLHARRAGAGQLAAQHDEHAAEFTWASDRSPRENSQHTCIRQQTQTAGSQSMQSVFNSAACQQQTPAKNEANRFRWISEYLSDEFEPDEHSNQRNQLPSMQQPQPSSPRASKQQEQQQRATVQHIRQSASQVAAVAAAGASTAAAAAGSTAALAATAAGVAGAAARTAASAAASWFDGTSGCWLDCLLGYDAQLAQRTGATAAVSPAAAASQQSSQDITAATAPAQQVHRRLPWQPAGRVEQPALLSVPQQHRQTAVTAMRGSQHCQQLLCGVSAAPRQQQSRSQLTGAVVGQSLSFLFLAAASVAMMVHEVADAAKATYTDTLKPAAGVLWQLVTAVGGLVAVFFMYLVLPLLMVVRVALQRLLLAASKLLNNGNQHLRNLLALRTAAAAAAVETGTTAALAAGATAAVAAGSTIVMAAGVLAAQAADATASATAGRTTAVVSSDSVGVSAQRTAAPSTQRQLLNLAAEQLLEVCHNRADLVINFPQNVWMGSNYLERPFAADAGYGPCAFCRRYFDRRVNCCIAVAIQVQILDQPKQVQAWCEAVSILKDLEHTYVMPLLGVSVGIVPRAKVCPATAAAAAVDVATVPTTEALVGCLIYEQVKQPRDFINALQHLDAINHHSRRNRAPTAASGVAAARRPAADASTAATTAAAAADSTVTAEGELRLATWCDRFQLAAQLVSGLYCMCRHMAAQAAFVQEATVRLQQTATATALSQGAAAMVHRAQRNGSGQLLSELVKMHSWVGDVTMHQLAAAVVVETSAERFDLKINPSLLILQQQTCASSVHGRRTARQTVGNSSNTVLPALGELLLMLVTAGTDSIQAVGLEAGCNRMDLACRLAQYYAITERTATMLLPEADREGLSDDQAFLVKQMVIEASNLLAWELPLEVLQLQGQQQRHRQQRLPGVASCSAAAAEQAGSSRQQQQDVQQATQASGSTAAASGARQSDARLQGSPPASSRVGCAGTSSSVQAAMHALKEPADTVCAANLAVVRAEAVLGFDWGSLLERQEMCAQVCLLWGQLHGNDQYEDEAEEGQEVADMANTGEESSDNDNEMQVSQQQSQQQLQQQQHPEPELASSAAHVVRTSSSAQEPPSYFICPITSAVMTDPVEAAAGYTYERGAILHWLQVARVCRSPMTNQSMDPVLVPNHSLRSSIMEWRLQHHQK